jgi:hypothetical protein
VTDFCVALITNNITICHFSRVFDNRMVGCSVFLDTNLSVTTAPGQIFFDFFVLCHGEKDEGTMKKNQCKHNWRAREYQKKV